MSRKSKIDNVLKITALMLKTKSNYYHDLIKHHCTHLQKKRKKIIYIMKQKQNEFSIMKKKRKRKSTISFRATESRNRGGGKGGRKSQFTKVTLGVKERRISLWLVLGKLKFSGQQENVFCGTNYLLVSCYLSKRNGNSFSITCSNYATVNLYWTKRLTTELECI